MTPCVNVRCSGVCVACAEGNAGKMGVIEQLEMGG